MRFLFDRKFWNGLGICIFELNLTLGRRKIKVNKNLTKLSLALFLLILISFVYANLIASAQPVVNYTPDDFFISLESNHADLSWGEATFKIRNPTPADISINSDILKKRSVNHVGSPIHTSDYYILENVTHSYNVTDYSQVCNPFTLPNGTSDNCTQVISGWHFENITREEFVPFHNFVFQAGDTKTIKIRGTWKPQIGLVSNEWFPIIRVGEKDFEQNKWAWWNTTYEKRIAINVSQPSITGSNNFTRYPEPVDIFIDFATNPSTCTEVRLVANNVENSINDSSVTEIPRDEWNTTITNGLCDKLTITFIANTTSPYSWRYYWLYYNSTNSADSTLTEDSNLVATDNGATGSIQNRYLKWNFQHQGTFGDANFIRYDSTGGGNPTNIIWNEYIVRGGGDSTLDDFFIDQNCGNVFCQVTGNLSTYANNDFNITIRFYANQRYYRATRIVVNMPSQDSSDLAFWYMSDDITENKTSHIYFDNNEVERTFNPVVVWTGITSPLMKFRYYPQDPDSQNPRICEVYNTSSSPPRTVWHEDYFNNNDMLFDRIAQEGSITLMGAGEWIKSWVYVNDTSESLSQGKKDCHKLYRQLKDPLVVTIKEVEGVPGCTGNLTVNLIEPSGNVEIVKGSTFTLKANATCTGGCCGIVKGVADPSQNEIVSNFDENIVNESLFNKITGLFRDILMWFKEELSDSGG